MKKFALIALLLVTTSAFASEVLVRSFSQYELIGSSSVSQEFEINPELGRAWVKVNLSSNDPETSGDSYRVKVPGLSYDATAELINYEAEGRIVTCATNHVRGRGIFRTRMITMTSSCKFEGRWRTVTYDDGFEIKKTKKYDIFLIVE